MVRLTWEDLEPSYRRMNLVWSETTLAINWLRSTWSGFDKAGLTEYGTDHERHEVAILAFTLAVIYVEFFHALDVDKAEFEQLEPEYFVDDQDLDYIRLGQMHGVIANNLKDDEDSTVSQCLIALADEKRPALWDALIRLYQTPSGLFASLYMSSYNDPREIVGWDEDDDDDPPTKEEIEYEVLNDLTADKVAAFDWIDQGMLRIIW